VEPLIFLAGVGLGLGMFIKEMDGLPYVEFLASGLMITAAMFTASFEMTYDGYVRLEFDKVYEGMLGAPLTVGDLMLGEILWCGTKGLIFSTSVMVICLLCGVIHPGWVLLAPLVGALSGLVFAVAGLLMTTLVQSINNFSFYFSGFISPMFFFSGVVFPISNLPSWLRPLVEIVPLTHPVRLVRGLMQGLQPIHLWDFGYMVLFCLAVGWIAVARIRRKLID
jgi:lipooligosaccharide transport system permease protein